MIIIRRIRRRIIMIIEIMMMAIMIIEIISMIITNYTDGDILTDLPIIVSFSDT